MKKAKKEAAPKGSVRYTGDDSDSDEDDEEGGEPKAEVKAAAKGEKAQAEDVESEEERDDVPKAGPSTVVAKSTTKSAAAVEADERAARKAEKAAKRDERRDERKARRKAEREAAALKAKAEEERAARRAAKADEAEDAEVAEDIEEDRRILFSPAPDADDELEADASGDVDMDETDEERDDVPDLPRRMSSPPALEPFPLPRLAPAPDAAVLLRQGMPTGLQDATFVDQDTRHGLDALSGLSERTQKRLAEIGVEELFAVQAAILPHLLSLPLVPLPHAQLSDFLISAPTGSGKTLAYAVPVVELLSKRVVTRLRALIVLPTRDLVVQVRETLEALAKGTGLMVCLA